MSEQLAVADRESATYPSLSPLGLVGVEEMCALLKVSQPTLDKIIADPNEGFPVTFKIGKRKYARFADIRLWVDSKGRSA